jgi:hypothetical protein
LYHGFMMCFEGIPSLMTSPARLGGLRRHYALKHKLVLGGAVRERIAVNFSFTVGYKMGVGS